MMTTREVLIDVGLLIGIVLGFYLLILWCVQSKSGTDEKPQPPVEIDSDSALATPHIEHERKTYEFRRSRKTFGLGDHHPFRDKA